MATPSDSSHTPIGQSCPRGHRLPLVSSNWGRVLASHWPRLPRRPRSPERRQFAGRSLRCQHVARGRRGDAAATAAAGRQVRTPGVCGLPLTPSGAAHAPPCTRSVPRGRRVFLAAFAAALGPLSFGFALGYSSPAIPSLRRTAPPALRLGDSAASWFGVSPRGSPTLRRTPGSFILFPLRLRGVGWRDRGPWPLVTVRVPRPS